jgi:hypothetical protein
VHPAEGGGGIPTVYSCSSASESSVFYPSLAGSVGALSL